MKHLEDYTVINKIKSLEGNLTSIAGLFPYRLWRNYHNLWVKMSVNIFRIDSRQLTNPCKISPFSTLAFLNPSIEQSMVKTKKNIAELSIFLLACAVVLILGRLYGTRYYIAWPDETLFTDIAQSLASGGPLGAPSYSGNGTGVDQQTYFMPPIYPLLLALWFKIVPSTLASARLLSNFIALFSLGATFSILRNFNKSAMLAGLIALALAMNIDFAFLYNWARPDILALTLSMLAISVYVYGLNQKPNFIHKFLTGSWCIATLGMLTHPIGGFIGFAAIPLHILITRISSFRHVRTWLIFIGIPMLGIAMWSIYIFQDWDNFYFQMIEWQTARKANRFTTGASIWLNLWKTVIYYGIAGSGWKGAISPVVMAILAIKAAVEKDRRRPILLACLMMLISNFVVIFGWEMPYPPLRLAPLYIGIALLADPVVFSRDIRNLRDWQRVLTIAPAALAAVGLSFLFLTSTISTIQLVREVRYSPRASAYEPATLANEIIQHTNPNSSIGIRLYPECLDLLDHSGHFSRISKLAGANLSKDEFARFITSLDYLAITDTALEPRYPGVMNDYTPDYWGGTLYRDSAKKYFTEEARIILPNGGQTILYRRNPMIQFESNQP